MTVEKQWLTVLETAQTLAVSRWHVMLLALHRRFSYRAVRGGIEVNSDALQGCDITLLQLAAPDAGSWISVHETAQRLGVSRWRIIVLALHKRIAYAPTCFGIVLRESSVAQLLAQAQAS